MGQFSMQHHPHTQQQGPSPSQHSQHSRPSSVVQQANHQQPPQRLQQHTPTHPHQQHPSQQPHLPTSQPQASAYPPSHAVSHAYQTAAHQPASASQDNLNYYNQPSPYSTHSTHSGYQSAETGDMMAAAHMSRPHYPPMSYHTPQSNSPASVASPSQHDQHRSIYAPPPPQQHMPQSMYYQQPPQYQSLPQPTASPYGQHAQHPQQAMTSQPNMMMSHNAPQNHMSQHSNPHANQHHQSAMSASPRPKLEPQVPMQQQQQQQHPHQHQQPSQHQHHQQQQLHKQATSSPMPQNHQQVPPQQQQQQQQQQSNGNHLQSPGNSPAGVNPNAAPGPIPATTPLVVRQDGNGVQWIAFEYSRDRVKMEYTIRCDVESVNIEELSPDFKQENCVYPRACCPKDQYRGNRLMYETDCNRVGWALAQLNIPLRGKRGLIQRAVDSWRNSNQDPRLRSRRVRRMAKMNTRSKASSPHPSGGPHGVPAGPGSMGPGTPSPNPLGKPGMGNMGQSMHHHTGVHSSPHPNGDHVGAGFENHHHQNSSQPGHNGDVRQTHIFTEYGTHGYPNPAPGPHMSHMAPHSSAAVPAKRGSQSVEEEPSNLFPDIPDAKKRKFILVEDNVRGSRLRVRVTLEGVDTKEIPDSFRKGSSVYPRTFFPREMQSPSPSANGSQFFLDDADDDGIQETQGREVGRRGLRKFMGETVTAPFGEDKDGEVVIPRMRKSDRSREVRLNDLGYRMAWLQSRVFAGRTVFLQRALDCYRNKTRAAIEGNMQDVTAVAPHYETRPGKRRWNELSARGEKQTDS